MTSIPPSQVKTGQKPPVAIRRNRSESAMPSAVRDLAELLAEIAVRQLRSQTEENQGEHTHE